MGRVGDGGANGGEGIVTGAGLDDVGRVGDGGEDVGEGFGTGAGSVTGNGGASSFPIFSSSLRCLWSCGEDAGAGSCLFVVGSRLPPS